MSVVAKRMTSLESRCDVGFFRENQELESVIVSKLHYKPNRNNARNFHRASRWDSTLSNEINRNLFLRDPKAVISSHDNRMGTTES